MIPGSCCCGEVRFSISEPPKFLAECHCSRCRKSGATPFAMVAADTFELLAGRDKIVELAPTSQFQLPRVFCGLCGTSLGECTSQEEMFPIPANAFDQALGMPIRFHEHCATKPSWVVIPDGLKQFDGSPV
jgi:hypothetical protein